MDIERALLKTGVTVAAMFAIYQGSQGMREFAEQRSTDLAREAGAQLAETQDHPRHYIESRRIKEAERRRHEMSDNDSASLRK